MEKKTYVSAEIRKSQLVGADVIRTSPTANPANDELDIQKP